MREEVSSPHQVDAQAESELESDGVQISDTWTWCFGHGEEPEKQMLVFLERDIYEYRKDASLASPCEAPEVNLSE